MNETPPVWEGKHYAFFQNRACEFFPCHPGVPEDEFNCLFCYCPLYALGEACRGNFQYSRSGKKICADCAIPHYKKNYGYVNSRYAELAALAKKRSSEDA